MPQITPTPDAPAAHVFQEGYEIWKCGCDIWLDYLSELPGIRTPAELIDANARLLARSLEISGMAAGALLKDEGLRAPTLNDQ